MNAMVPDQPRKQKGSSGCLLALGIVGGIALVLALVVGVLVWRVLRSETAQEVIGFIGDASQVTQKALNAPGAAELRKAGCDEAMVMDLADFVRLANRHFRRDGGLPSAKAEGRMVTCGLAAGSSKTLPCDEVARTYVVALGGAAGARFTVLVQRLVGGRPRLCEGEYDETGKLLPKSVEPAETPAPDNDEPEGEER